MGVYIKGMEMPMHCLDCPFMVSRDNDDCILQSAEANGSFENWEQMKAGCPLVHVPPHGRLKDADALKDYMIEALNEALPDCRSEKQRTELRETTLAFMQDIDECPTIIPASEETED